MPFYEVNALRFLLAHRLRSDYGLDPADFKGLFLIDSLRYWQSTQLSAEDILRRVAGHPDKKSA